MRNNLERMGGNHQPQSDTPSTETNQLSFVLPTEHVELPSKGLYYPENHPLHNKDTVEIRFMTAKDEDTLTSKNLIKKGLVIERLISDLVVDKTIRTDSLLIGDRNAIIVAARISGYGADYETKVNCPSCGKNQEYTFDLTEPDTNYAKTIEELHEYGVERTPDGYFLTTLPMSKVQVLFKLLNGRDEKVMVEKMSAKSPNQNQLETNSTDSLRLMIGAINGISDRIQVENFINTMPARDSIYFKKLIKTITPNLSFNNTFECRFCGFDTEMEVPFTADFFWINR